MGQPVQRRIQRRSRVVADRAAVHGFAGLFRSAADLVTGVGCGLL
jgi:hypothetical protein